MRRIGIALVIVVSGAGMLAYQGAPPAPQTATPAAPAQGGGRRGGAAAQPMPVGDCTVKAEMDVETKMRDGTVLRSNVFTPDQPGPFPVILQRVPYNKDGALSGNYGRPEVYAVRCYIVVEQDVRGQYKSDGVWYPFRSEATDGYDTIEWAAKLPKSNGKVGMYGFSYPGATQWLPATLRPPHLTAIVPAMTSSDYREGWTYEHGALMHGFTSIWPLNSIGNSAVRHFPDGVALDAEFNAAQGPQGSVWNEKWKMFMPMKDYPPLHPEDARIAPYFFDWLKHPSDDAYWQQWSIRRKWSAIAVPALNFEGWYDIFVDGGIENFVGMRKHAATQTARDGQRLVVGPWLHLGGWSQKQGAIDFGPEAANPIQAMQFRWFDYWLKGTQNGVDKEPKVRLFVMGANKWRTANEWPVEGTQFREFYLHSKGGANTSSGNGTLDNAKPTETTPQPDKYKYDPKDPVPSIGGRFQNATPGGPMDQRPILSRQDMLVYTTKALDKDTEVTGPITVTLYAASSATDTDFVAKLDDVYPDGASMGIAYGIQRARYRDSDSNPTLLKPGTVYRYTIHVWPTSNLFKAGHQIRVEITSSSEPMWDRNPNTGHPLFQDAEVTVAEQTIFHDKDHPSTITLPIVESPIK
jgi:putative CocE/NonD family hydrolase